MTIDLASLPDKTSLTGTEQIFLNDAGVMRDVTPVVLAAYVASKGAMVGPYADKAALTTAYPVATSKGITAIVGAAAPYTEYVCNGSAWLPIVTATTDASGNVTGLQVGGGVPLSAGAIDGTKVRTAGAGYTGTGAALSFNLGFRPALVIIKQNGTQPAVFKTANNWQRQTDTLTNGGASVGLAITITDQGFDLGTDGTVNTLSSTYNYFAVGNLSGESVLSTTWQGNATNGHIVDALAGKNLAAVIVKRDSTLAPVLATSIGSWLEDGTSGTYLTVNSDGTLVTDASTNTNEWSGVSGEAINAIAFLNSQENVFVTRYTGDNVANRRIPVPWQPGLVMIWPNGATASKIQMWWQGIPQGTCALSNGAAHQTGRITTVDGGAVTLAAQAAANSNGIAYTMLCIRQSNETTSPGAYKRPPVVRRKSIQLSTGYIDCGVGSSSLNITGAYSLEFYGTFWPGSETGMVGGAGVNDEVGKQHPLIWRSNGADNPTPTDTVSWGMELCAPQFNALSWTGCTLIAPTMASMQLMQTGSTNLDYFPMNSGYVIDGGRIVHLVVCHYGNGSWKMFADGVLIKERKRDILTAVGGPLKANGATVIAGAKTIIGARLRGTGTPEFAHNLQFKLARLYSRGLAPSEVVTRYQNCVYGYSNDVSDFVEEWDANNASGVTLAATKNAANNGTIVNGVIYG